VDLLPLAASTVSAPIRALRPCVTQAQAIDAFAHGVAGSARQIARGRLRSVAEIYIPFRLFAVTMHRGSRHERAIVGLDGVAGVLDVYRFDRYPEEPDVVDIATRNHLEPRLSHVAAREVLASRMRRLTYERLGFLVGGAFHFDAEPFDDLLHVPYWAGFFGRGQAASLVVMDAVRRQIEGGKVKRLISEWLNTAESR
jgi:hypothetical protein